MNTDLTPKYGAEFVKLIQVTLLQSGDSLLTQFEDSMQQLAIDTFRDRVEIVFNARVVEVTDSASASAGGVRARAGRGRASDRPFLPHFLRSQARSSSRTDAASATACWCGRRATARARSSAS